MTPFVKSSKRRKNGEEKKGDLAGIRVYKFKLNKREMLLSYQLEPDAIVLLSLGSHENFVTVQQLSSWLDRIAGEGALQDGEHAVPLLAERVEA